MYVGVENRAAAVTITADRIVCESSWHVVNSLQRREESAQRHDTARGFNASRRPDIVRMAYSIPGLLAMEIPSSGLHSFDMRKERTGEKRGYKELEGEKVSEST